MKGIGYQGLRIEIVAADSFADSHAEIHVQADPRDPYPRIFLVGRGKVAVVVVV